MGGEKFTWSGGPLRVRRQGWDRFGWWRRRHTHDVFKDPDASQDRLRIDAVGGSHHDGGLTEESADSSTTGKGDAMDGLILLLVVSAFESVDVFCHSPGCPSEVRIDEVCHRAILTEDFGEKLFRFPARVIRVAGIKFERRVRHDICERTSIEPLAGEGLYEIRIGSGWDEAFGFVSQNFRIGQAACFGFLEKFSVWRHSRQEIGKPGGEVVAVEFAVGEGPIKKARGNENVSNHKVHGFFCRMVACDMLVMEGQESLHGLFIDGTAESCSEIALYGFSRLCIITE